MAIKLGSSDIAAAYLGSASVSAMYLGLTQVWGGAPAVSSLPSGALAVFIMSDYEAPAGGRKIVPNRLAAGTSRDPNILDFPRRLASSALYTRSNCTVTDNVAVAPDGSTEFSKIVDTGAGVDWFVHRVISGLPAGIYTICITLKNNLGTDQAFVFGALFGQNAIKTAVAGAGYQRHVFTTTSAFNGGSIGIRTSAGSRADFDFGDLEIFPGSADLRASGQSNAWDTSKPLIYQRMDLLVGETHNAASAVAGGVLPAGSRAYLSFDQLRSMGDFTVIAVMKKTTGSLSNVWQSVMEALQKGTQSNAFDNFEIGPAAPTSPRIRLNGVTTADVSVTGNTPAAFSHALFGDNKSGPFVGMWRRSGSVGSIWINGVKLYQKTSTITAPTIGDFVVSYGASTTSGYEIDALAVYPAGLSDAEMVQAYQYLKATIARLGSARARVIIPEGDSITDQNGTLGTDFADIYGVRLAQVNSSVTTMIARAPITDGIIAAASALGQDVVLPLLIGANDLPNTGVEADVVTWLNNYRDNYILPRRAAGAKIVLQTILPQGPTGTRYNSGGFNASRAIANPILRSWVGTYAEAIADYDTNVNLGGSDTAPTNRTYFTDDVHPAPAGHALMNPILAAAVASLG